MQQQANAADAQTAMDATAVAENPIVSIQERHCFCNETPPTHSTTLSNQPTTPPPNLLIKIMHKSTHAEAESPQRQEVAHMSTLCMSDVECSII